jgi:ribosomal-protein-alanine acetyltransferase
MKIHIKRAEQGDIPRIFEIARDNAKNPWKLHLFEAELRNRHACLLCAETGGGIIGFCDAHIVLDNAHINEICVERENRKKGAATALVGRIIEIAKEGGCKNVTLEVREQNVAARALYEKLGFRIAGRREGFYRDPPDNGLTMIKDI